MIYDDLCYEHEADIFANQMKYVKPLSPYEIFMANLEAGNDEQLIIKDLIESYGVRVDPKPGPNRISAISTVETIFRKYGYHTLDRVLRLCVGAWEGDAHSFSANVMNAITKMIITYGDDMLDEVFKERAGQLSLKTLSRMAKERHIGALGYAEVLVIQYNGRSKNQKFRVSVK